MDWAVAVVMKYEPCLTLNVTVQFLSMLFCKMLCILNATSYLPISRHHRLLVQTLRFDRLLVSLHARHHPVENPARYGHFDSGYSAV